MRATESERRKEPTSSRWRHAYKTQRQPPNKSVTCRIKMLERKRERGRENITWLLYPLIYFAYFQRRHHHHFTWSTLSALYASLKHRSPYNAIHIYQHSKRFYVRLFALLEYSTIFFLFILFYF